MKENRRQNRDQDRFEDARWLHGHHQGRNSDRGNYTVDTHFNRGYGRNEYDQFGDTSGYNSSADFQRMHPEGRFAPGGSQYAGEDFSNRNRASDNPYGMTFMPSGRYNSGRHYDARADYSDHDYNDLRTNQPPHVRYGMADDDFGHDVRRGQDKGGWMHSSRGDYESYQRYEKYNPNYDNDYRGGFAGRNYSPDNPQYGEGNYNSNLERWEGQSDENYERYMRNRDRR